MSEGSVSTTSSRIKQFGLYRTIDARTEEFLRLSRKRQIKQGCACAAVATAITVTIVVVVLLIYEYMIVVETNLVQIKRRMSLNHTMNDQPVADKLDRSNFGFDQDYYEKMPLLVNGLQESSFIEPTADVPVPVLRANRKSRIIYIRPTARTNLVKFKENKFIRRTSPRPFDFEYKSPYPQPFSKSNGNPKNWVERYRNAQRLKNLHEVIKYLEKTLNAKFGDTYLPSKAQVAFSGVFMSPMNEAGTHSPHGDLSPQGSMNVEVKSNHKSDPLFTYRPDNPGDVNLLADGLKFSPTIFSTLDTKKSASTIHKYLSEPQKTCFGIECNIKNNRNIDKHIYLHNLDDIKITTEKPTTEPKSFSVMLNLMPLPTTDTLYPKRDEFKPNEKDKIYLTTSKPWFYFKRKSIFPIRRTFNGPKYITGKRYNYGAPLQKHIENIPEVNLKLNVYSNAHEKFLPFTNQSPESRDRDIASTSPSPVTPADELTYTNDDAVLNSSQVEDYHIGSSGIIPIELIPTPVTYPIVTPMAASASTIKTETVFTNPPEIFKFSPEDAKIPEQYVNIHKSDRLEYDDTKDITTSYNALSTSKNRDIIRQTLAIKLRNIMETTTDEDILEETTYNPETTTESESETTTGTYVPIINGHYRNAKHKTLTAILQENSERYRKKRLQNLLTISKSTYVPMYEPTRIRDDSDNE